MGKFTQEMYEFRGKYVHGMYRFRGKYVQFMYEFRGKWSANEDTASRGFLNSITFGLIS
jgi:hypothetical protein